MQAVSCLKQLEMSWKKGCWICQKKMPKPGTSLSEGEIASKFCMDMLGKCQVDGWMDDCNTNANATACILS